MKETLAHWEKSPASHLTIANYLPKLRTKDGQNDSKLVATHNVPSTMDDTEASIRFDSIMKAVDLSGKELGRDNLQRLIYIKAMGARFASIDSLHRSREISSLIATMAENSIDINDQAQEVKSVIIEDIDQLNALEERSHGTVDPDRLAAMIARVRHKAHKTLASDHAAEFRKAAASRLLETLPHVDEARANEHIYDPSRELLETYEPRVRKKNADLLGLVPTEQGVFDRNALKHIFEGGLHVIAHDWQLDNAKNWTVEFGGTNVSVDNETNTIWIPEKYPNIPHLKVEKLLVHELGGHLLRNLLGEKTGDIFFATSLPGRVADEEALLTVLESSLDDTPKYYDTGIAYYLGVGLGLDTLQIGEKMPPEKLQQVLTDLAVMNPTNSRERGESIGMSNTSRLVRGMPSIVIDGTLHQAINRGDLKYAHGQRHAIEWLTAHRNDPAALDFVLCGKFAYSDPQQEAYARKLYNTHIAGRFAVPSAA
ncbi:MAG TPA: hypothetical protein VFT59_00315 [Candidatus Saccharimonadales bacterium]|nr:hypothetical protein [Candidatus Saccharimonadales bacterium]